MKNTKADHSTRLYASRRKTATANFAIVTVVCYLAVVVLLLSSGPGTNTIQLIANILSIVVFVATWLMLKRAYRLVMKSIEQDEKRHDKSVDVIHHAIAEIQTILNEAAREKLKSRKNDTTEIVEWDGDE